MVIQCSSSVPIRPYQQPHTIHSRKWVNICRPQDRAVAFLPCKSLNKFCIFFNGFKTRKIVCFCITLLNLCISVGFFIKILADVEVIFAQKRQKKNHLYQRQTFKRLRELTNALVSLRFSEGTNKCFRIFVFSAGANKCFSIYMFFPRELTNALVSIYCGWWIRGHK